MSQGEAGPDTWTGEGGGAEAAEGGTPGGRRGDPHGVGAARGHPYSLRNVRGPTSSATCVAASSPSQGGRNLGGQTGQDGTEEEKREPEPGTGRRSPPLPPRGLAPSAAR